MKQFSCVVFVVLLLLGSSAMPNSSIGAGAGGTVTGVVQGTFALGASFASISLNGIEVGTGVFVEPDGTATGTFSAVLLGRSVLGQQQQITIDGRVLQGAIASGGSSRLSGIASIDLGDGMPSLTGVPFSVETTADSLVVTINSTTLPTTLTGGSITIE
jgi:hypothetical protein